MNYLFKTIKLNEKSNQVNLLYKALIALGLPVDKTEVAQNKAGENTLKQVRITGVRVTLKTESDCVIGDRPQL